MTPSNTRHGSLLGSSSTPAATPTAAFDKAETTLESINAWSKRAIERTNEIASNEDLRKEIAKRTK